MNRKAFAALSVAALALSACGPKPAVNDGATTNTEIDSNFAEAANTADASMGNVATAAPAMTGQMFANTAAASDAFEIATSKLAATASKTASIKSFASQMIKAHTESTAKLKKIAAGVSPAVTPDPTLSADQQEKLDALKAMTSKDFDAAYVADQVAGHQATLDALQSYSATGDVPAFKDFATTLVPTVAAHLNMAKSLKS